MRTGSAIQTDAVVQRQGHVQGEALEVAVWINVVVKLEIARQLVDARGGLKIYDRQVCLHVLAVQGSGSRLSCTLD